MKNIIEAMKKHKETILYLFFGGCTVFVNITIYYISAHICELSTLASTILAWIIAVVFAYITNKLWVFESKSWEKNVISSEFLSFFVCRVITGLLDVAIMIVFVDKLHFYDMLVKFISNILVIFLNYLASKFIIFKKK